MFERFDRTSRTVVLQAGEEARARAATKIEAEHFLLALARHPAWDAGRLLADAGLDHRGIEDALDLLVRRSLEAVGLGPGAIALADRPSPATSQPGWGASAKSALRRATVIARDHADRSMRPTHILLAVLRADEGTVPRALAAAGVDARALVAAAEATLGADR